MSVRELKSTIAAAVSNLDSQIRELQLFLQNNDKLMQQISRELDGSTNSSATKMKNALLKTKEQINHTIRLVESAKTKLKSYSAKL